MVKNPQFLNAKSAKFFKIGNLTHSSWDFFPLSFLLLLDDHPFNVIKHGSNKKRGEKVDYFHQKAVKPLFNPSKGCIFRKKIVGAEKRIFLLTYKKQADKQKLNSLCETNSNNKKPFVARMSFFYKSLWS